MSMFIRQDNNVMRACLVLQITRS